MKTSQFKKLLREVVKDAVKEALNEFLTEDLEKNNTTKEVVTPVSTPSVGHSSNEKVRVPVNSIEALLEETKKGLTKEEITSIAFDSGDVLADLRQSLGTTGIRETGIAEPKPMPRSEPEAMIPGLDMSKLAQTVKKAQEIDKSRKGGL